MSKQERHKKPPKLAQWLLRHIIPDEKYNTPLGDFEEFFNVISAEHGVLKAWLWYWGQVLRLLPQKISKSIYWSGTMFKNYIMIALRNLKRYKGYSLINIAGLAIGIAVCILIFLFVEYEIGFDYHFINKENIYRVVTHTQRADGTEYDGGTPFPTAVAMQNDFPQLKQVTQIYSDGNMLITVGMERYKENAALYIKPEFFEMFNIEMVIGDKSKVLDDPQAVILTNKLAEKYFGQSDPVGKILQLDNKTKLHVTGVVANPPAQTSLPFDLLISWKALGPNYTEALENWGAVYTECNTFIQLYEAANPKTLEEQFESFEHKYMKATDAQEWSFRLQPLKDIHFNPRYDSYNYITSRTALFAISAIGFVILIIACINFINLTTAQAMKRAKEMGMRKVLGAGRTQIIRQMFGETSLFTFFSILIALFLVGSLIPYLNQFLGNNIQLQIFSGGWVLLFLGLIYLFVSSINGFYPAFILSRYRPAEALKERISSPGKHSYKLRNSLVLIQFIISQVLIVGTLVIAAQMKYISNKDLGFRKESILTVPLGSYDESKCETLRERWLQNPHIQHVSFAWSTPMAYSNFTTTLMNNESGDNTEYPVDIKMCDKHFLDVFDIPLIAGRFFDRNSNDESNKQWVINEAVVRQLGLSDPQKAIGKQITVNGDKGEIIGIIRDFNVATLHEKIKPIVFFNFWPDNHKRAQVLMDMKEVQTTIDYIKNVWTEYYPEYIFEYSFFDDYLAEMYTTESKLLIMIQAASFLAIFLGCLGLVGLASFMVIQRTKEIGIRKVLGASISSLYCLISKEFVKWVVIANIFAWPIVYILTKTWLQEFAYRIQLGAGFFLLGGLISFGIAVLVVSVQVIRATTDNPVNSLQYE